MNKQLPIIKNYKAVYMVEGSHDLVMPPLELIRDKANEILDKLPFKECKFFLKLDTNYFSKIRDDHQKIKLLIYPYVGNEYCIEEVEINVKNYDGVWIEMSIWKSDYLINLENKQNKSTRDTLLENWNAGVI